MRFAPDALEFQLLFWVSELGQQAPARSDVNLGILQRLRAAGIDIPYPQRVVHLRQEAAAAGLTA
jgi:small-conductance mechanosensitive channel